jgi:hypothetical protein
MSSDEKKLVAKLNHQINSPLAAIRNALYLASVHSVNVKVVNYLKLADEQITRIVGILKHPADEEISSAPL